MTKGLDEWDIIFQKDFKAVFLDNGDLYMSQVGDEFSDVFLIKKEHLKEFATWLHNKLVLLSAFELEKID